MAIHGWCAACSQQSRPVTTRRSRPAPSWRLPAPSAADGADAGVAAHYGDPLREQRLLTEGLAAVDLSHRGVVTVTGPDRLSLAALDHHPDAHRPRAADLHRVAGAQPQGSHRARPAPRRRRRDHLDHRPSPARAGALTAWLDSMRFMLRVEVADVTADWAVLGEPRPGRDRARASRWPGATRGRGWSVTPRRTARSRTTRASSGPWRELLVPRGRPGRGGRRPRRWPAPGRPRRCGSRPGARGSASRPTTAPSPTRSTGCGRPCTCTRAATAGRRRSPACTTWAARRGAWCSCTSTARATRCPRAATPLELDGRAGRLPHLGRPALRGRPDRARPGQAQHPPRRGAHRGRPDGRPDRGRRPLTAFRAGLSRYGDAV